MRRVIVPVVIVVLSFASALQGQTPNASMTGQITDPSKALIAGAKVALINTGTNLRYEGTTNETGNYYLTELPAGTYRMEVEKLGFKTVIKPDIILHVQAVLEINFEMALGSASEIVSVTAGVSDMQLATSSIGAVVNSITVRELPLNGRDWTQLAALQAGLVTAHSQPAAGGTNSTGPRGNRGFGNELSDAGHRPSDNSYRINGISVVDFANEGPGNVLGASVGVDAIQEFSVFTTNYSAEYGRATGAVINAIMRSGTNAFHGDAYWFLRDKVLDARNFFDTNLPPFHRNQFGASGGGPIKKEKTFIFVNYEAIRQDRSVSFHDFVPSAAARAGNLCSVPTGGCTPTTITVDSKVAPYLGFYPLPNGGLVGNGDTGIFNTAGLARFTQNYVTVRGDQKFSDKDSLAASWLWDTGPLTTPDALGNVINELSSFREMVGLEETHIFSPTLVNSARVGYSRSVGHNNVPVSAINPLAKDHSLSALPGGNAPILTVPGLTLMQGSLGAPTFTNHIFNSFQFYDDAFFNRGVHSLKFGFAWERMQYNCLTITQSNGNFVFPSLAGFLQNQPSRVTFPNPALSQEAGFRQTLFGGYLQDDWRWRPNLMLNLGVRYDPTTLPTEAHDRYQVVENLYGGSPVPVKTLWAHNQTLADFTPRVGFSWDPFHNGKTAIRGGFGMYDVLPLLWTFGLQTAGALPFSFNQAGSSLPPGSFPTGAIALVGFNPKKSTGRYVEQDPHRAYAMIGTLTSSAKSPRTW